MHKLHKGDNLDYNLIACDMDGTLFGADFTISQNNVNAIKGAISKGCYFVLSTGRPMQATTRFVAQLGLENVPIILFNGAMVLHMGKPIYNLTLEQKDFVKIVEYARQAGVEFICWSKNMLFAEKNTPQVQEYKKIPNIEPIFVNDLTKIDCVTKVVWFASAEETTKNFADMKLKMGNVVNVHPTRATFLEFVNKNCSKAIALDVVCKTLGVDKTKTIAIGDGFNDLSMLNFAGLGVAMENAPEEVKSQADFVTSSCQENGVKRVIDRFIG